MSSKLTAKPEMVDIELEVARQLLIDAGFEEVPEAHVIASDPEWLLKVAAVVVLRNITKMMKSGIKDTAKILVDIASGGVRAGSSGDNLKGLDERIEKLLNPPDEDIVDDDIRGEL